MINQSARRAAPAQLCIAWPAIHLPADKRPPVVRARRVRPATVRNNKPIVHGMRTNPNPGHGVPRPLAKSAVMLSLPNAEPIHASLQSSEMEGGVPRVATPQVVVLGVQFPNFSRQREEQLPETPGGDGSHVRGGKSRWRPRADSLSASSNRKSSLPAAESRSIRSSQRA